MCSDSERRRDRRLDLSLDVEFTPRKYYGSSLPCTGRTCNVSAGGVYLESPAAGSVTSGMDLVLTIALPHRSEGASEPLALHCEGKVVRVIKLPGPDDERFGVAVQFNNRPNIEVQSLTDSWDFD
ncbi:MAG TPA: PilZ domain-containing protein [Planctomycetota bacterium]|nr:PilZ domain-containing protein [Planctomycetota bacterium]